MEGDRNRVKHIWNSSASSLLGWEVDDLNQAWEMRNVRKLNSKGEPDFKNSYTSMTTNNSANLIVDKRGAEDHRVVLWNGSPIVTYHSFVGNWQMWLYGHGETTPRGAVNQQIDRLLLG